MPTVHINHLNHAYRDAVPIFNDASATFSPGWTGLVGANGAGKTTLLRIIAGHETPDSGHVDVPGLVVLCEQIVDERSADVLDLAADTTGEAYALRGRLDLEPSELDRWPTLSPGERKRWQVAAALFRQPDVLLVDEPTNHIDPDARALLVDELERYRGTGIIVSHDRGVLNRLCRRTARVHNGVIELWNGAYDIAREEWERAATAVAERKDQLRAEERRMRQLADRQRRSLGERQRSDRRERREAGHRDSDARSMERKIRQASGAAAGEAALGRSAARADRAGAEADSLFVEKELGSSVFVDFESPGRRVLLSHVGPLDVAGNRLAAHIDAHVERGSRIWLRGPNGAGKTTLLRAMIDASTLPDDRLLWLAQDQSPGERQAVLAEVGDLPSELRGRVLNVVAALGVEPSRLLDSELPSPGEARKLTLALGLARHAWCVVLDEPTNHLDLPSIERLEAALHAYPGALLVVTHDEQFGASVSGETWTLDSGALRTS